MQGNQPWYTPTTSALHNQQTDNYFYNYSQSWERNVNGYHQQTEYYNRPGQYSMNSSMRTCTENQGFGSENGNYPCPPMYFRQETAHGDVSSNNARPRTDRSCSQNGVNPQPIPTRGRPPKGLMRPNDSDAENFSSVFTQSLTSLYSQDTEANFEEKTFKCDPDAPPNDADLTTCARPKTEDLANNCNTEYSFNSVFNTNMEDHPPGMNRFENLKIKQEFPDMEMENSMRYDNYSMDDTYLKRRRSLADAYNRKRKRSSVPSMSYRTPADSADTKGIEMFHSQSQWIPNSVQSCPSNGNSSTDTYQTSDFSSANHSSSYDAFDNGRGFKRQSMKPRGSRGRSSTKEVRVQNAIKRIPKKVSPLTVYAKVLDDRILEVTCRRYKKRTKPTMPEESFGSQYDAGFSRANESWENTYHSVGKVIQNLVDKVAALYMPKRTIDLSRISPMKAKELLFRFCSDFALDYRDFQDFNEILNTNVTIENEENVTRNRKRRSTAEREEYHTKKSEKLNDEEGTPENEKKPESVAKKETCEKTIEKDMEKNEETKTVPKTERKAGRPKKQQTVKEEQPRVLRSLPSRQPPTKVTKKSKKTERQVKSRYPKRRIARGGRGGRGRKLKILIDLSKDDNGPAEILELDSDSSRQTTASKADKDDNMEDLDDDIKKVEKVENEAHVDENQDSPNPQYHLEEEEEEEDKEHLTDVSTVAEENASQEKHHSEAECHDVSDSRCSSPEIEDVAEMLKNMKKEVEEDDSHLRQPPQLVCMAPQDGDVDKQRSDSNQEKTTKDSGKGSDNGQSSSTYLHANGVMDDPEDTEAPSPPKLKKTCSSKYRRSFSAESNSSDFLTVDSDDPDGKLVIDMDAPEPQQDKTSKEKEKDEDNTVVEDLQVLLQQSAKPADSDNTSESSSFILEKSKPIESDTTSQAKENSNGSSGDDDCIVLKPQTKNPVEVVDLVMKQKPTPPEDRHSLLKEKLLEKPIFKKVEDELMAMQKAAAMASNNGKGPSRSEQDESILRTLLLETEVIASTSSADGSTSAISSVMGLTGQGSSSSLDFLKRVETEISQLPNFPTDPPIGLSEAMKLLKCQSYPYLNSSSSETPEDSQNQNKNGTVPPGPNQDDSKEAIPKDPKELQERIKKLKNEILCLQMMSDQKEKEKIAIICFKRYKEELLKRIYRAYAYTVQDHVRDWIVARREHSGENRLTSGSPSSAHKASRSENSRISEAARLAVESFRDLNLYPAPAPAHAASTHRPQSIHSPQSLPKNHNRNSKPTGEKVSTVETMVAKATENYGLDMRNLRDGLRTSPESSIVSGTILQKVLSSSSSQNSSPDQHRPWTPDKNHKKSSGTSKPIQPSVSKPYTEPYGPLDMKITHKESSHKNPEHYRSSPDTSRSTKSFQGSERSQIQSLLSEPVHSKANHNPYRAWSIQAGGRISEDRTKHSKPVSSLLRQSITITAQTSTTNVESPLQRQLNSHKAVSRPNFAIPSPLEASSYNQQSSHRTERSSTITSISGERSSTITSISGERSSSVSSERSLSGDRSSSMSGERSLTINGDRPLSINGERPLSINGERPLSINGERPLSINGERPPSIGGEPTQKPSEDRRQHTFGPTSLSSNSAMPYGGHILRNNSSPLTPTVSSNKPCISAAQGSGTPSPSPNTGTTPLCMGCGVSDAKFLCSGCRKHWYCSPQCQSLRWPEHSRVCAGRMFLQSASSYS